MVHVLIDCPRLREIRKDLRTKVGDCFNSVARLLGGWKKDERGKWPINRAVVNAVIEFAEKSGRFRSRTQ